MKSLVVILCLVAPAMADAARAAELSDLVRRLQQNDERRRGAGPNWVSWGRRRPHSARPGTRGPGAGSRLR